jgi:hypothetical protein
VPRTRPGRYKDPTEALDDAVGPRSAETAPSDVECSQCGCAFTNTDAFDRHRPDGKCVRPTDAGLVVAPRVKLTWSMPVRVPVDVDAFGNVTRWIDVDREIAGHWDDRVWRDYP